MSNSDLNLMDLIGEEDTTKEETVTKEEETVEETTDTPTPQEETVMEVAEEVVEAAEVEEETEKEVTVTEEVVDESGLNAPEESEVKEEAPVKEPEKLDDKFVDTASFLSTNALKIDNAKCVPIKGIQSIPEGKFLLFVTNVDDDADMILLDNPNRLAFEKFVPEKIVIEKSGVIATSKSCRTYVAKTNVIQYKLNPAGSPVSMTTFKKIGVSSANPKFDTESVGTETKSVDEIKLHITSVSAPLAKKVKDLSTVGEIRNETVVFLDTIVDINHLIKINNMMMEVGL